MTPDQKRLAWIGGGIAFAWLLWPRKSAAELLNPSQVTEHFTWEEFASHDGVPVPEDLRDHVRDLCKNLEKIRASVGESLHIVSGFRSQAHNEDVGGVKKSQHMLAYAADIAPPDGWTVERLHDLILSMIDRGEIKQGGVGIYPGWVHYDIRGYKARWDNR